MPAPDDDRDEDLSLDPLTGDDYDALDTILDELRQSNPDIPNWEACDGFLAAVVCCRREIAPDESIPVLLGDGASVPLPGTRMDDAGIFTGAIQQRRFVELWSRRAAEIAASLDAKVESLDDERSYQPEVMDILGAITAMPEDERPDVDLDELPSIAQAWAMGFMAAVDAWPDEWTPPRDKESAEFLADALDCVATLTEPDAGKPELPMFEEDGPPTISKQRLDDYGEAIWAVYDLRRFWKSLGPRVEALRRADVPGRNDPCFCGSGKKYKKCHGA